MIKRLSANKQVNRREFLKKTAQGAAFLIVPRHVLGGPAYVAPSDKLNVAAVGVGGRGRSNIQACSHENIYALCDIDDNEIAETLKEDWADPFRGKTKTYRDYREMLSREPEIDALIISTPDHMHTPIASNAMDLGKHLYIEKPLCHTVAEARFLARRSSETNIVSQMGNQGHAGEGARLINEWVADGVLGSVKEVHCWTNRPVWPQGIARPEGSNPVPSNIDWDLWLGGAPYRPYLKDRYHRFNWRGWLDFGTGVVGDMGAHIIDHPYWALDLDLPTQITASSSRFGEGMETFPIASKIHFRFPSKGGRPAVDMTWYDGGLLPERPEILEQGRMMGNRDGGVLIVGEKNTLMHDVYGRNPRLIPESVNEEYEQPAKTMERSAGIYQEWIDAIKDRGKATTSHFGYSGQLSETMLLGNIATMRAGENKILEYDGANMRFTNDEGANRLLDKEYRAGFAI